MCICIYIYIYTCICLYVYVLFSFTEPSIIFCSAPSTVLPVPASFTASPAAYGAGRLGADLTSLARVKHWTGLLPRVLGCALGVVLLGLGAPFVAPFGVVKGNTRATLGLYWG